MRKYWTRDIVAGNELWLKIISLHNEGMTSVDIGKMVGKDHTTILHHLRKANVAKKRQNEVLAKVEKCISCGMLKDFMAHNHNCRELRLIPFDPWQSVE